MITKEPINIKTDPSRKYKFKLVLKIKKLKSITKNGYAISKIDAVDAPSILIPEKMKKFANVAKITERRIKPRLSFPDPNKTFIDCESKSNIGKVIMAMSTESIKIKDNGETLSNIFWSIVYTKPQVTAAAMAYINPTVFIKNRTFYMIPNRLEIMSLIGSSVHSMSSGKNAWSVWRTSTGFASVSGIRKRGRTALFVSKKSIFTSGGL